MLLLATLKMAKAQRRGLTRAALARVELAGKDDRLPGQVSSGE